MSEWFWLGVGAHYCTAEEVYSLVHEYMTTRYYRQQLGGQRIEITASDFVQKAKLAGGVWYNNTLSDYPSNRRREEKQHESH